MFSVYCVMCDVRLVVCSVLCGGGGCLLYGVCMCEQRLGGRERDGAETGTLRFRDILRDQIWSTGERYSSRTSLRLGWLGTLRSSANKHGHMRACGDTPTRENATTGQSLNLGPLQTLHLQTVFALGEA